MKCSWIVLVFALVSSACSQPMRAVRIDVGVEPRVERRIAQDEAGEFKVCAAQTCLASTVKRAWSPEAVAAVHRESMQARARALTAITPLPIPNENAREGAALEASSDVRVGTRPAERPIEQAPLTAQSASEGGARATSRKESAGANNLTGVSNEYSSRSNE